MCRVLIACVHGFAAGAAIPASAAAAPAAPAPTREHREFDAMLEAAFTPPAPGEMRTFILHFSLPGARAGHAVGWQLALHRPDGRLLRQWRGRHALRGGHGQAQVRWRAAAALPGGIYELRLQAGGLVQRRPIAIGRPALLAAAPAAASGAAPRSLGDLPYDIVYGNLHSQTNHSDGGGDLAQCQGAQEPLRAPFGPSDAFAFAQRHGLDFLLTSEHNHMYDGSDRSDPGADPLAARQRYRLGLDSASDYNAAHPGFVALYGQEWGVISGGGHLNILDSPALLGWERSADGQPFADVVTPRNDYAALYTLMKEQGWLGQFNHPRLTQFPIGGQPMAYSADAGAAMALCEIMNSNAFSARIDEGETRHNFHEEACNRLLEAGYRLAFSSNQDNHCANWGAAYGNRTGILLPRGAARTPATLLAAIRARRVFASMDKLSAIALTANDTLMGGQADNSGALTLQVHFASGSGRGIAKLDLMEGIPGRRGAVRALPGVQGLRHRFMPAPGAHFYYARIIQDDGRQLWSAPVWVNQR
jgi:hypothetical protein